MTWREILEREHRVMYEVLAAAEKECAYIDETGDCHTALVQDMIEFFRYFADGLHDPKEEGLLYARCHRRGMTDEDQPLEQLLGEHEWSKGQLVALQHTVDAIKAGRGELAPELARELRDYVDVYRRHMEVEETQFFDLVSHYLTENDLKELSQEFAAVYEDELEEGVHGFYEELAHRVLAAETAASEPRTPSA